MIRIVIIGLLGFLLVACEDNSSKNNANTPSVDNGVDSFTDVASETTEQLLVRTSIQQSDVSLNWNGVSNADSYRIVVQAVDANTSEYLVDTQSTFVFTAEVDVQYIIQVYALNDNGDVITVSSKLVVALPSPEQSLNSDNAP